MTQCIRRDDVIGHQLVKVLATSRCDGSMDYCDCLLVLNTGLVFRIPAFADEPFVPATVPTAAKRVHDSRLDDVCGSTVVGLLRPCAEDEFEPGTVYLGVSSGKWIKHEPAMPHGLGAAGIHVLNSPDVNFPALKDFWQE
jgi:hypothetical protein